MTQIKQVPFWWGFSSIRRGPKGCGALAMSFNMYRNSINTDIDFTLHVLIIISSIVRRSDFIFVRAVFDAKRVDFTIN